jgi:hypothetical protein
MHACRQQAHELAFAVVYLLRLLIDKYMMAVLLLLGVKAAI